MTRHRDFDRIAEAWLAEGPTVLADRVLDAALDEIHLTGQRRGLVSLPRRTSQMNLYAKLAVAAVAVIAIAAVGIAVLGPGTPPGIGGPGSSSPSPTPSVSPSPSAAPSAASGPWWAVAETGPCGGAGCGGILAPGTYASRTLESAVTYSVPEGWVNNRDWPDYFQLIPDTPANRTAATSGSVSESILIVPRAAGLSSLTTCDFTTTADGMTAAEYTDALAAHDAVDAGEPLPIMIGGLAGRQLDLALAADWTGTCPGGSSTPAIGLNGDLTAADGTVRLIILDRPDGGLLLIRVSAPGGGLETFQADAMRVVESFTFDLGASS